MPSSVPTARSTTCPTMARSCTVCSHPESVAINEALILEKRPNRRVASQYDVSEASVRRHREHIPKLLVEAAQTEEIIDADNLLGDLRGIQERTLAILEAAEATHEHRTALSAIREARSNLELLARLLGELDDRPQVNVTLSPEWLELRTTIITALEPHQEARQSVLRALDEAG